MPAPRTPAEMAVEIGAAAAAPPEAIAKMAEVAELVAATDGPEARRAQRRTATLFRLVESWGGLDDPEKALPIAVVLLGVATTVIRAGTAGTELEPARAEIWKQLTGLVADSFLGSKEKSDG